MERRKRTWPLTTAPTLQEAKKRLTATVPKSKFESSHCKQTIYQNSNRNKNDDSVGIGVLTGTKDLSHDVMRKPDSNRSWYRLEFNISPTKQRTEVLSNRS
jgi:hypothetical protein